MLKQGKVLLNRIHHHAGKQGLETPVRNQIVSKKPTTVTHSTQRELEENHTEDSLHGWPLYSLKENPQTITINKWSR